MGLSFATGHQTKWSEFYNKKPDSSGWQAQPAFTCSKLTIETLEERVKYVQS